MLLVPDLDTFQIFPWDANQGKVGRLVCDIANPDGSPFAGCPRGALKRVVAKAKKMGYEMMAGPEAEFFLFQRDSNGASIPATHDTGGYFDLSPRDLGEEATLTTRSLPGSMKSISSTVRPSPPPTPSSPSASWSKRSR
jgi:glutamine synthetase